MHCYTVSFYAGEMSVYKRLIYFMFLETNCTLVIRAKKHEQFCKAGEILCRIPPYGYIKDPDNKNHWLIDEGAADVVRTIYDLYLNGMGTKKIADYLESNDIFTPTNYMQSKGLATRWTYQNERFQWTASTVNEILSRREYIGDVVNFKSTTKSYKNHKKIIIPVENRLVFSGVNDPIISNQDWEKAQAILAKNKRVPRNKKPDIFQSYLFCADCGNKLHIRRKTKWNETHYICSGYGKGKVKCSTHYIKQQTLVNLVLENIQSVISLSKLDKEKLAEELLKKANNPNDKDIKKAVRETEKLKSRCAALDKIIQKLFEDRVFE